MQAQTLTHLVVGLWQVGPLAADGHPAALGHRVIHMRLHLHSTRPNSSAPSWQPADIPAASPQCAPFPAATCFADYFLQTWLGGHCSNLRSATATKRFVECGENQGGVGLIYGVHAHMVHCFRVDERAQGGGRVHAAALLELADLLGHRLDKLVVDALLRA